MRKYVAIILTFFLLQVKSYGQILQQIVNLKFTETSLEEVFNKITQEYQIEFAYSKDIITVDKKISVQFENKKLSEALNILLRNEDVVFEEMDNQIVLKRTPQNKKQSYRSIHGKVIDASDGKALSYASVGFAGKKIGTVTNNEGEFRLRFPASITDDTLKVSFIGYKNHLIPVKEMLDSTLLIRLQTDVVELAEVQVARFSAQDLLKEAIAKISTNYPIDVYRQQFYLRDWTWMEGEPIQVTESVYDSYRGEVSGGETKKQMRLIQGRKMRNEKKYQQVLKAFPALSGFDMGITPYFIYNTDLTKYIKEKDFLGKNGLENHVFTFGENTIYDGREVYVINYDQKDKNKALYKGAFYIDIHSLAIIKITQSYSPKGIKHASIFGPRVLEKIFGLGENVLTDQLFEIRYKEIQGKWYLDYLSTSQGAYFIKTKRKFNAYCQSKSDIVVTETQIEDVLPFPDSLVSDAKGLKYRHYGDYDEGFWENQNLIKPDHNWNIAFGRISGNSGNPSKDPKTAIRESVLFANEERENKSADLSYIDLNLTRKSNHFIFYFSLYDSAIIDSIENKLESNYQRIIDDFKIKKMPITEVKIFPSIETYHTGINNPDAPDWMAGSAGINKINMVSPINPGPYHAQNPDEIWDGLVHEFAHVVHIDLLNNNIGATKSNDVIWLWEAMACYEARNNITIAERNARIERMEFLKQPNLPTLDDFNDISNGVIYSLGFFVIDYIKEEWGMKTLLKLLKSNGDIEGVLKVSEEEFIRDFYNKIRAN